MTVSPTAISYLEQIKSVCSFDVHRQWESEHHAAREVVSHRYFPFRFL